MLHASVLSRWGARVVDALVIRMIVLQPDLRLELKATEVETATELDEGGIEAQDAVEATNIRPRSVSGCFAQTKGAAIVRPPPQCPPVFQV